MADIKIGYKNLVGSIYYRWAIDGGATHEEAIKTARKGVMADLAKLDAKLKMTPEEKLEAQINELREVAEIFDWTVEELNGRIECLVELYEKGKKRKQ